VEGGSISGPPSASLGPTGRTPAASPATGESSGPRTLIRGGWFRVILRPDPDLDANRLSRAFAKFVLLAKQSCWIRVTAALVAVARERHAGRRRSPSPPPPEVPPPALAPV
jgi:hypothetical protein